MTDISSHQGRDLRLDFFRGLALITIFINHVPGTIFENYTSRNFGFSDAAEAFVLMSGISAGLAYSKLLSTNFMSGIYVVYRRALRLYLIHLLSTFIAVIILLFGFFYLGTDALLQRVNLYPVLTENQHWVLGFLTLGHQIGYFNILPIYVFLLLITPLLALLAGVSVWLMLILSFTIWFLSGLFEFNIPTFPLSGYWFLNPFCWQFLFSIGFSAGLLKKRAASFVAYNSVFMALAAAYVVFATVVVVNHMWQIVNFAWLPSFLGGFDKGNLPLFRLMHILALFYIVAHTSFFKSLSTFVYSGPISVLGKHSLAVFAWGSVLAMLAQVLKDAFSFNTAQDFVILVAGLLIQFQVALYFERKRAFSTSRESFQAKGLS